MPQITNYYNLPDSLLAALLNDPYSRGDADISVTGLISPPQVAALYELHKDDIVEDVADLILRLIGQGVHYIIDKSASTNELTEKALFIEVDGWKIKGGFDSFTFAKGTLSDYKITTMFNAQKEDHESYEQQLNIYAYMLRRLNFTVSKLQIVALLRDWSKGKVIFPDYPQIPVQVIDIPLWDYDRQESFLKERIALHKKARTEGPASVPCTEEERWPSSAKYRIVKVGNKKATETFDSKMVAVAALEEIQAKNPKYTYELIEEPTTYKRCAYYCAVAPFCEQWQGS